MWMLGLCGLLPLFLPQAPTAPPDAREQKRLVEEFLALGPRARGAERARQREILARFDLLPAPDARAAERFAKDVLAQVAKQPGLPKGSGRQYLWEEEQRGLFLVGGRTKKPRGLLIGMHGGGVGVGDAEEARSAWESAASSLGWLAIFPQVIERTERGWIDHGTEEFVLELVERAVRTHDVPVDRVFFAGHSMGGYGTWTLGARHADRVAGLAASAGAPTPLLGPDRKPVGVDWGVIENLRNTRIAIFQSADDPNVPPEANRVAVEQLKKAKERYGGYPFDYWEVPRNGHDLPPGGTRALLERVADAVRIATPERVVWQPVLAWKRQFHWLHWESPREGTVIDARLDRPGARVEIDASGPVDGLTLVGSKELFDPTQEWVVTLNGVEAFRGLPERRRSTILDTASAGDPHLCFELCLPLNPAR